MNLSKHFTFEELTSTAHADLLEVNRAEAEVCKDRLTKVANELLEPVRVGLGRPMVINSGYRGITLNEKVGGSATSQHCKGEAADFNVDGYDERQGQLAVMRWMIEDFKAKKYNWGQLLLERGCIHISLGTKCEIAEYDVPTKTKVAIPEFKGIA